MKSSIQKWGNSSAVRLPKAVLETAQLKENEQVEIIAVNGEIKIKKIQTEKPHRTLKDRIANFDGEYTFEEWDTGKPMGDELC